MKITLKRLQQVLKGLKGKNNIKRKRGLFSSKFYQIVVQIVGKNSISVVVYSFINK